MVLEFAERLNELIIENKLDAKQLSQNIGCSDDSIYEWISGKRNYMPNIENMIKLADYFHCSISFLVGIDRENYLTNPKPCKPINGWFRTAVESKGFTLHGLATKTKLSTNQFYKWINGKTKPGLDSLIRIAKALDCSLDYLLGRE